MLEFVRRKRQGVCVCTDNKDAAGRGPMREEEDQIQEGDEDREHRRSGGEAGPSAAPAAADGTAREAAAVRAGPSAAPRPGHRRGGLRPDGNEGPPTLNNYFGRRGSTVRPADSFRIFCGVLSLLKTLHARGVTLRRVRPSMLRITSSGV